VPPFFIVVVFFKMSTEIKLLGKNVILQEEVFGRQIKRLRFGDVP
jgi:hypothetical protein